MRFKKLLAAAVSGALAVMSLGMTSLTVSADDNTKTISSESTALALWGEYQIEVGVDKPIQKDDLSTYDNLSVTFSTDTAVDTWEKDQIIKAYCKAYGEGYEYSEADNKSVNSTGITKGVDNLTANTEYTISFSINELLNDFSSSIHEGDDAATVLSAFTFQNMYQASDANLTVTKIELTTDEAGGTGDEELLEDEVIDDSNNTSNAQTYVGSMTITVPDEDLKENGTQWGSNTLTAAELLGNLDSSAVKTITFTNPDSITYFQVGYNSVSVGSWFSYDENADNGAITPITVDATDIDWSGFYFQVGLQGVPGVYTVTWVATADAVSDNTNTDTNTDTNDTTTTPSTPSTHTTVPSYVAPATSSSSSEPQISGDSSTQGWSAITEKITETVEGGKVSIDMNGVSVLPKEVLESVAGTDVDLVLDMGNGVTWTINGTDVSNASDINLKVSVGTRHIPDSAIDAIEGANGVKQISLAHSGSFGFTATMSISLGKNNNGQYANLFYYNKSTKSLEFVDASIISGGKANLVFSHASDYAIIMSDAPLGDYEDVSAAAGTVSSESVDTTVFFVCGAVVLAVAAAYVIYRKRSRG